MPGGGPGIVSTQWDRGTLLHGELNALQAGCQTTVSSVNAGSEFPQFQN